MGTPTTGHLVRSLLIIARAWFAAGKPSYDGPSLGGFEEWSAIIGGMLAVAGVPGFLGNLTELYNRSDHESAQWEVFLRALHDQFSIEPFPIAKIVPLLTDGERLRESLPEALAEALQANKSISHRLGKEFGKRADRRYGDEEQFFLERAGEDLHHKVGLWRIGVEANPAVNSQPVEKGAFPVAGSGLMFLGSDR